MDGVIKTKVLSFTPLLRWISFLVSTFLTKIFCQFSVTTGLVGHVLFETGDEDGSLDLTLLTFVVILFCRRIAGRTSLQFHF